MILTTDMGNTDTVIDGIGKTKACFIGRVVTDQGRANTEYVMDFKNILGMHQIGTTGIEEAIFSSVIPPVNSIILSAVRKVTENRPLLAGSGMKIGVNVIMDNPKIVDSDQIVGAVATSHEHPLPLVVIDMGTATTLYTVDKRGSYIGGVIFPGPKVSLNSLNSRTAQLPYISLEVPSHVIGKNTIDCMRSGTIYGNVDMVDEILDRMEKELGESPTIVATGKLTKPITSLCRHRTLVDDALLLRGLLILYRKDMEVHQNLFLYPRHKQGLSYTDSLIFYFISAYS